MMVLGLYPEVVCEVGLICLSLLQGNISTTLTKGRLQFCMSKVCTLLWAILDPSMGGGMGKVYLSFIRVEVSSVLTLKGIGLCLSALGGGGGATQL